MNKFVCNIRIRIARSPASIVYAALLGNRLTSVQVECSGDIFAPGCTGVYDQDGSRIQRVEFIDNGEILDVVTGKEQKDA